MGEKGKRAWPKVAAGAAAAGVVAGGAAAIWRRQWALVAMRVAIRVVKSTEGMDVTRVLEAQHAEIRRAFRRAALPGGRRPGAFRELVRMLAVHEAAEEAHVHPAAARASGKGRAAARARLGEEAQAKQLLADLWEAGPRSAGYLHTLRALRRAVLMHAAREEREEFPALGALSPARRRMLGLEVKLARELAPTRPHPGINTSMANRLAMSVLGPADRARDLLQRWRGED